MKGGLNINSTNNNDEKKHKKGDIFGLIAGAIFTPFYSSYLH